ncbi:MAG: phosphatase, partial [Bacteroidota bacterium]
HDFIVPDDKKALVNDRLGIPAPGYYSFFHKGWRFVMLNGNEISTFSVPEGSEEHKLYAAFQDQMVAEGRESALYYNGTLSETQMSWFRQELEAAEASQEHVLICCHYPTYPEDTYNLWHSREVVEGIGQFSCVRAYFNGHRHAGGYAQYKGCHYLTFLSVLDVPELTAWSMVEVFEDRLEVKGFGKEEDRTLRY